MPFERILRHHSDDTPEAEYTKHSPQRVRHAGQLKLLCSEIEFLLRFGREGLTVIYAGAAPGIHIPKLAEMFGRLRFVLIDPTESAVEESLQISIVRERMTNELAARMAETYGHDVLFVSDVRVAPVAGSESDADHQRRIQADMDAQLGWHHVLDPVASMFKFRLPWNLPGPAATTYLDGEIHLPIFGRRLTHETRLVVRRGAQHVQYDHTRYERQMAFFNGHQRPVIYEAGRCYDCTAFRMLVARFLEENTADGKRKRASVQAECEAIERDLERRSALWEEKKLHRHRTLGRLSTETPHP